MVPFFLFSVLLACEVSVRAENGFLSVEEENKRDEVPKDGGEDGKMYSILM